MINLNTNLHLDAPQQLSNFQFIDPYICNNAKNINNDINKKNKLILNLIYKNEKNEKNERY